MKVATVPHPIPYQGGKRNLAAEILRYFPPTFDALYEAFAGSAAMTIAAAAHRLGGHYSINDLNKPQQTHCLEMMMTPEESVENTLAEMFRMSKARFGNAIKGYWFCDDEACPGCGRPIDVIKIKGEEAISLNAFIHRKPGILIGYLLCKRCARQIFRAAEKNPYQQIPLHATIEQNLIAAYQRYLNSLPA